jgi:hypothetical protein
MALEKIYFQNLHLPKEQNILTSESQNLLFFLLRYYMLSTKARAAFEFAGYFFGSERTFYLPNLIMSLTTLSKASAKNSGAASILCGFGSGHRPPTPTQLYNSSYIAGNMNWMGYIPNDAAPCGSGSATVN